jgi:predicted permease
MQDLRFAIRQLRKNSGFAVTTILTLALGIGATTAIFSLVNAVLLRPLPFPQQDRLVWLHQQDHSLPGVVAEALSYPTYFDWRTQDHTFSGIASYRSGAITLEMDGEAQHLDGQTVSANFFQVLGIAPMLGRDFRGDDEKPGNRAVMLSYSLWQSAFGAAKDIAGKTIRLGDHDYIVAGVMPKGFQFPLDGLASALWLSLADDADGPEPRTGQRGNDSLNAIGRLKPGVTLEQARSDMNLVAANVAKEYPDYKWYSSALIEPELQHMTGDTRQGLGVLFGAVTLVLLIACANVAGLLMARGSRRTAEFALRSAIGASQGKIIRQLLMESLVLSLCGGAAGTALAYGLLQGMVSLIPRDIPRIGAATIDGSVLAFAVSVSVVTGLLFGLLPAWRLSHLEPVQALREGARGMSGGRGQHRLHTGLVVAQTAIGLVLLVSSGLLIRSFIRILAVDPGFDPKHVLTARIGVSFDRLSHDQHSQFYDQLVSRLSALPGVQAASAGWPLPMSSSSASISFSIQGKPVSKADHPSEAAGVVLPGYFESMRIPLLSGRLFGQQDGVKAAPVIIINQAFARKYFSGQNPLGQHIQVDLGDGVIDRPMREVVGVVGDIRRRSLTVEADPQYYLPFAQSLITNPFLTIRTTGDPSGVENEVRAVLREMDKSVPVYQVSTLETYVEKSEAQPRFQTLLLFCFAGIALILSAIGLYGLLSYMVAQRTLEIGLRMALGAKRTDVLRMIVRRGLTLALIGSVAGLVISAMITRLLSGMLYGIRPSDMVTFATVTALLLLVSLTASIVPAYRAARLDPMETLREQ